MSDFAFERSLVQFHRHLKVEVRQNSPSRLSPRSISTHHRLNRASHSLRPSIVAVTGAGEDGWTEGVPRALRCHVRRRSRVNQVERLNGKERKDPGQSSGSSGDADRTVA